MMEPPESWIRPQAVSRKGRQRGPHLLITDELRSTNTVRHRRTAFDMEDKSAVRARQERFRRMLASRGWRAGRAGPRGPGLGFRPGRAAARSLLLSPASAGLRVRLGSLREGFLD